MSAARLSSSFNSLGTLSLNNGCEVMEKGKLQNELKEIFRSRIFLGRYMERRLIDEHIGYRDIVVVSSAEVELKRDLLEAQYKLNAVYTNIRWIGITETDLLGYNTSGVCLWTQIDNQPFGPFWFQIKSLKFRDDEIIVSLKCIRHITEAYIELEPILIGGTNKNKDKSNVTLDAGALSLNETCKEIVGNLKSAISINNVKDFFTFLFAIIIAFFTGSTALVNFLGNFILALVREISIFTKNSTPIFLGTLEFFSKCVGGFYILLAMLFKPNTPVPSNNRLGTGYHEQRSRWYDDGQVD